MAVSGLAQRFAPLDLAYQPFGPRGLPPFADFLEEADEASRTFALRLLRRSRSHAGYCPWRSANDDSAPWPREAPSRDGWPCKASPRSSDSTGAPSDRSPESNDSQSTEADEGEDDDAVPPPMTFTTVMVQNVAANVRRNAFVRLLNNMGFGSTYDFVHLPMTFGTSRNRGFAFVNFRDARLAEEFLEAPLTNETRAWKRVRADVQGLNDNVRMAAKKAKRVRHYRNRPLLLAASGREP